MFFVQKRFITISKVQFAPLLLVVQQLEETSGHNLHLILGLNSQGQSEDHFGLL